MPRPVALVLLAVLPVLWGAEPISYNRDVRPILSENCFSCHGFDEHGRKAKLRLDRREDAVASREDGPAIVPGKLAESLVWQRIISDDPDDLMPPPESHLKLSASDKTILRRWIEQGAPYEPHWAFVAPRLPAIPKGSPHPVDAFIRAKLRKEGLKPSPEADRATLIRRISLDLIGLPPSAEEVEAFVQDPDPRAYERLVDRLLASPHHGERLALEWMDAARYADTNGYSIDGGRHLFLWRDWVIQAFNDNLPYDRFLLEQLAGDLLPGRTEAQLVATGFQRNNMNTHEGGTIPEENLVNYNADRVRTLGEAVLGLTLACAQCHDHKFDPLSQRDYFRLFAYFNTLGDQAHDGNYGNNSGPTANLRTPLRSGDPERVRGRIAALRAVLATPDDKLVADWEREQRARLATRGKDLELHPVKLTRISTPNVGAGFTVEGNHFRGLGAAAYDMLGETPRTTQPITGIRLVFPATDFRLTTVDLTADRVPSDQVNIHRLMRFSRATASSWNPRHPASEVRSYDTNRGWSPVVTAAPAATPATPAAPAAKPEVHITLTFAEPITAETHPWLTTSVFFAHRPSREGRLYVITGEDDGTDLPDDILAILGKELAARTTAERARLWEHVAGHAEALRAARVDLANAEQRLHALTGPQSTMVMAVAAKPRETFVLARGDYSQPGEKVSAGTPGFLPPLVEGVADNRLGLARWVTQPENPLTARVAVNRAWKLLFGSGIVQSSADFGLQGSLPSHPELLDWLAVDFVESGWDLRRLLRTLALSETYRQSSRATPALLEKDPSNRLLARGPRFRLPAEFIRDHALKTSGLLVPDLGGPSVNPYSPFDLWREVSHYGSALATAQTFVQDHGDKLYRRSLYTYWKRTAPPANLAAFDAPNREVCAVDRPQTITPLQALVTLNDTQFAEAARGLGARAALRPGDDAARIRWASLECLGRPPSAREAEVLLAALARERTRYAADPARAAAALKVGESPVRTDVPPVEQAAWMQVASLLLNLSETITRN
jgi:hypothetical protein